MMDEADDDDEQPLLYNAVSNSPVFGLTERRLTPVSGEHRVYWSRWIMLFIIALLNLSNGMMWMTFGSIAPSTKKAFCISDQQVNWLSIVFMVTTIILGLIAVWLLDKHGLRCSLIIAAWLNGVGALLRVLSFLDALPQSYKFPLLLTGQTLCGCAQPFVLFAPTKLAAQWFADDQRTLANTIGSTANPIGIMLGSILSTVIVPDGTHALQKDMSILLYVTMAPAVAGTLLTTICVRRSLPLTPPSHSAAEGTEPVWDGMKALFRIRPYWILSLCYGGGLGLISTFVTFLEQLLCPQGYSSMFAGLCGALLFGIGLIGAIIASLIVDKTKKFEETAKVLFGISSFTVIVFMIMVNYPHQEVLLAVLCSLIGFFGIGLSPICLELSVESSFPVAEGTSAGLLVLSGQIQAAIYSLLMNVSSTPAATSAVTPCNGILNESAVTPCNGIINEYAVIGFICVTALLSLIFIYFYECKYRRVKIESQLVAESIISNAENRRRAVLLLT